MRRLSHSPLALLFGLLRLLPLLLGSASAWACELSLALLPSPGMYERQGDGPPRGLEVAIARELEKRSGCRLQIRSSNPSRLWPDLRSGAVDISGGTTYLPERLAEAEYILLVRLRPLVLLPRALARQLPRRTDFDADPQLRLGVVRQGRRPAEIQAWVDQLGPQGRLVESVDEGAAQRAYDAGRSQAILVLPGSLQERPASWWRENSLADWFPQASIQFGWAVSRHSMPEALRRKLRDAAESARRDGTWQRLTREHLGDERARHWQFPAQR